MTQNKGDLRVLQLLSRTFPNIASASSEIINLEAILNLPKGTEHFMADIHGEYEAFLHILKNASGNIKRKVNELFSATLSPDEIRELCTLIYYPEQKLEIIKNQNEATPSGTFPDAAPSRNNTHITPIDGGPYAISLPDFYSTTLQRLIRVCQSVSSKYTRSKVRKALPTEFAYIIEELLHESPSDDDKQAYFSRIIETIVQTGRADAFIIALATNSINECFLIKFCQYHIFYLRLVAL